ncbi:MAG TPA: cell division protein ZapA [Cyclobacteriaceae bacterium]|jgi:cell division protein ZapA|nr:cell division protein ZapA [Cyclobacteriaceae bacterium]
MKELSIKIKIADREYPMKVIPEDEERIRKAGRVINEKIKHYAQQFGIDDKQDLLAMVAFDILVDKSQQEEIEVIHDESVTERIASLGEIVTKALDS